MSELQAPFPYFGGKRRAARLVWDALGDPGGYVEPFAGSAAVLLARPNVTGRRVETLNDSDGWLVNMWRAIQLDPAAVAGHACGPVTEIDYHARLAWLQERRTPELVSWLEGDPENHDARAAGWWLYVCACGIGDPWGPGPWRVIDGHLRKLPHLGDAGKGISRGLPHLGDVDDSPLVAYLARLQARLSGVRITCGTWTRTVKPSVIRATAGNSIIGVFLDPPYATSGDLYATTNTGNEHLTIADDVRQWCQQQSGLRIILCGYDSEHDALLGYGWSVVNGKSGGGAGYNVRGDSGRRERLWRSPECLDAAQMLDLWEVSE